MCKVSICILTLSISILCDLVNHCILTCVFQCIAGITCKVCKFVLSIDLLQQRLKNLREMAKKLSEDDWRYTPLEQLIGLH